MDLGVVPERFKVANALDAGADRLAAEDAALVEADLEPEAPLYEALHDFELHLAHELQVRLAQARVPDDVEGRVLLFQLPELAERRLRVAALGQQHPIAQHRLQRGGLGIGLKAQALAGAALGQARDGADRACRRGVQQFVFRAGVEPELIGLGAPGTVGVGPGGELGLDAQHSAGYFEPAEALPVLRAGYFEYPRPKVFPLRQGRGEPGQGVEQLVHAIELQRRAEEAGEELTSCHGPRELFVRRLPALSYRLKQLLAAQGKLLCRGRVGDVYAAGAETALQLGQAQVPVGTGKVHFVDEDKDRDAVAFQQPPERLRVALHTVSAADHKHGAVEHLERAFRLGGEIDVSGSVEQREFGPGQAQDRLLGEDGDAPGAFKLVRVEKGVPVVHAPELPQRACAVEQRLAECGLARVHVRKYTDNQPLHPFLSFPTSDLPTL